MRLIVHLMTIALVAFPDGFFVCAFFSAFAIQSCENVNYPYYLSIIKFCPVSVVFRYFVKARVIGNWRFFVGLPILKRQPLAAAASTVWKQLVVEQHQHLVPRNAASFCLALFSTFSGRFLTD